MRVHLPDDKGTTKFELATRFSKATGKKHPDTVAPKVDKESMYLWALYREATEGRQDVRTLPYAELDAWLRVTGRSLTRFELNALRAIDRAFCLAYIEVKNGRSKPSDSNQDRGRSKGR